MIMLNGKFHSDSLGRNCVRNLFLSKTIGMRSEQPPVTNSFPILPSNYFRNEKCNAILIQNKYGISWWNMIPISLRDHWMKCTSISLNISKNITQNMKSPFLVLMSRRKFVIEFSKIPSSLHPREWLVTVCSGVVIQNFDIFC